MRDLTERDKKVIWHPYTSAKAFPDSIGIVRGSGTYLFDESGKSYLDAISSWWVNLHGHAHPYISKKVYEQMLQLEHCIFAGFTHEPAIKLAERLLQILPQGMARVFYSDNGSTAVEVAIKMALQFWKNQNINKTKVIALENAYHGDTFGAMSVSGRSIFTDSFQDLLFDVTFLPVPTGDSTEQCFSIFKSILSENDIAALIVEPLVQGSGGMKMYVKAALQALFQICKETDTLIIADEVMTGFGRTGSNFACNQIDISPDIICLSKGLTGGFMPMGITAVSDKIFQAFYDDDRMKTLYHGHSYTANATACAAALASLDLLLADSCTESIKNICERHRLFGTTLLHHPFVENLRQTGTIIALDVKTDNKGYNSSLRDRIYNYFFDKGVLLRPLGNTIYIMPPYCITNAELDIVYDTITGFLKSGI